MKRALGLVLLLALGASAQPDFEDLWIRSPSISPDGSRIAFSWRGDLWVVPSAGGEARPLTGHAGYETAPVWSPDGRLVAFAADHHGNLDVYVVSAEGGEPRRLTFHQSDDVPSDFTADGAAVVFSSRRLDAPASCLPSAWLPELWSVPVAGGRPRLVLTTPAENARYAPDGAHLAYEDLKGFEDPLRKHQVSAVARDVWVEDVATGTHRRLTGSFRGEDRSPTWLPDGGLAFLSERGGSFEVWRMDADGGHVEALTHHGPQPVRFLSGSRDGTLCYVYDGGLYVLPRGGPPRRVALHIQEAFRTNAVERTTQRKGATELAVAPSGDEVAFVVRGDVFVASVKHGTTRRVTHTPGQERSVAWRPDGRGVVYAAERDGSWNLYETVISGEEEKRLWRATLLEERPLLVSDAETFQPLPSPDGRLVAYLHERDEIRLLDRETGETRRLVGPERNYSYTDGDLQMDWSPDGRWLACTMLEEGRWLDAVGVVEVATGRLENMTRSGYHEGDPRWSPDGRVLAFVSTRYGRRAHGSWGSEADVIGIDLTRAAHDRATLPLEEFELLQEAERKARKPGRPGEDGEDAPEEGEGAPAADGEGTKPPPAVEIEFEGRDRRTRRLTLTSAELGDHALSKDGEVLVYLAKVGETWGLWANRIRKEETSRVASLGPKEPRRMVLSPDGKEAFVLTGDGGIVHVGLGAVLRDDDGPRRGGGREGGGELEPVAFAAELEVDRPAERAAIFEHVWRQVARKFYAPDLHGVDWPALRATYVRFLPQIADNHDFADLLSEMLGELNASHTGCRYRPDDAEGDETASLGLLYDPAWEGDGLRVAEVLAEGPADRADSRIAPGVLVTDVDGEALAADVNPWPLLRGKAGKRVRLGLRRGEETWIEVLRPVGLREEANLRYERWVRRNEALVEEVSGGRCGYVHVRGMNDASFRRTYQDVLGRHGAKEALVVDTRFNGGGWLHDDLVTFLGGRTYAWFVPRGKERGQLGAEPSARWDRPVVVVQSEGNYSDAHFFPYAFRTLGLGKLVGSPVAGTATAVWWERQIDPTLVFGIPQVGMLDLHGHYLENQELVPDVEVASTPEELAAGTDRQLLEAVRVVLEAADARR